MHLQQRLDISERRACRAIGQPRSTQRKPHRVRDDEAPLTTAIIQLASAYGRYGYPPRHRVAARRKAGGLIANGCCASGSVKGLKYRPNKLNADDCGSTMVRVFGCGPSTLTTCGLTISWPTAQSMGDRSKCSR